jgi:hypothetical protein
MASLREILQDVLDLLDEDIMLDDDELMVGSERIGH